MNQLKEAEKKASQLVQEARKGIFFSPLNDLPSLIIFVFNAVALLFLTII
jgi:hypothetical protein